MATTSTQLTGPSSSPLWDVFLSFYGKDTRRNFISHLYYALDQARISTFKDDPALEKGEEIASGILNAIDDSNMFVVVLSENYARSSWCLNELVAILDCKRTKNQVVPVYYYVDPSDVRYQKGSFGEAFELHKKRYSVDTIDKWISALAEIADISGYHLNKDAIEDEANTIQDILKNVAPQSTKELHLEKYLLEIDSAVEEIHKKLKMESNDIRAIGICGMGGIGKTTTAKAFYNKYSDTFGISCFIENVKQNIQGGNPLLSLLRQLLIELRRSKDFKVPDVESGIKQLKQILLLKKALIVLDDLDDSSHSELLVKFCNMISAESRIIITTRDTYLLNKLKVDISEVDIYMVKELGPNESLKLFSYHAFRKTIPPEIFRDLSIKFVNHSEGLPLALKVLGSSLRGRTDVSFWKAQLEKVEANPEIHKILKLSYDDLSSETEKAIFLDIVFFFVGQDRDEAAHVFRCSKFCPDAGISILEERCLITIDKYNRFQMHTLIQDMGRELGKSRHLLWRENALEDLQNLEETDKIECLILDLTLSKQKLISAKIFERMPKLRLLQINDAHDIKGSFRRSFRNLRCIRWHCCPWTCLPSDFRPQNLTSIDMPFSEFKTLWKGTMPLVSLKTIDVSYSKLETTPDFRDVTLVEKLSFQGCYSLQRVHTSIGKLTSLSYLDLSNCDLLKELPKSIAQCSKLVYLNLSYCLNLRQLPDKLGYMKGLKMLDASYTAIKQLPVSIACLGKLVNLKLNNCKRLRNLPDQIGYMEGLRTIDASCTPVKELPNSIGCLRELVDLKLSGCKKLRSLPDQFGYMEGLRTVDASYTAIKELPNSIACLRELVDLKLSGCKKLRMLPEQFGNMKGLRTFDASFSAIEQMPHSCAGLINLVKLDLGSCENFRNLPVCILKNMKKLETLAVPCNMGLCLPIISTFSSLRELYLFDEDESFTSSKFVSLSDLSNLEHLSLGKCTSLGSSFPELPHNLKELRVYEYATLEQLPDLSRMKKLNTLEIRRCCSLNSLSLLPPHLEQLTVSDCTSLQNLPDLSTLKELEHLDLVRISSNLENQVRRDLSSIFQATDQARDIEKWFAYIFKEGMICFVYPPNMGDNLLGITLWVIYTCKTTGLSIIRAVFTNKKEVDVELCQVSFRFLDFCHGGETVPEGEVEMKMCGAHIMQNSTSLPMSIPSIFFIVPGMQHC